MQVLFKPNTTEHVFGHNSNSYVYLMIEGPVDWIGLDWIGLDCETDSNSLAGIAPL